MVVPAFYVTLLLKVVTAKELLVPRPIYLSSTSQQKTLYFCVEKNPHRCDERREVSRPTQRSLFHNDQNKSRLINDLYTQNEEIQKIILVLKNRVKFHQSVGTNNTSQTITSWKKCSPLKTIQLLILKENSKNRTYIGFNPDVIPKFLLP